MRIQLRVMLLLFVFLPVEELKADEPVVVNAINFARAESDMYFSRAVKMAGGLAKFYQAGAVLGIYGNTAEEAIYPLYFVDNNTIPLDCSARNYILKFELGKLLPVNEFWSLTMYDLPDCFLVSNPLNRY